MLVLAKIIPAAEPGAGAKTPADEEAKRFQRPLPGGTPSGSAMSRVNRNHRQLQASEPTNPATGKVCHGQPKLGSRPSCSSTATAAIVSIFTPESREHFLRLASLLSANVTWSKRLLLGHC